MSVSVRPLSAELAIKVELELNETPRKLEEGIKHLKEWIAKQPHLRARTDDQWLAAFLRGCKYSLERAKEKIDLFYAMRSIAPEMTALKYWQPGFKEILRSGYALILPKRLRPADPKVILIRAFNYDASRFNIMDALSVTHVLQMISIVEDDAFVIAGMVLVVDLKEISVNHLRQMTPTIIKKVITYTQDASPMRVKELHLIGLPSYAQTMFNFGFQMLTEKFRRKIFLHKRDDLCKLIPKELLPAEYGGDGGTIQDIIDHWNAKIKEYELFLNEDVHFGTDEEKRLGKPKTADSLLGLDGSFRQLEFD